MKTQIVISSYIIYNHKILLIKHKKLGLWLPVGGHIEKDETPDDAVLREAKEEVGLNVEILLKENSPLVGNTKKNLALPFSANVHSVGDHDHACFYYLCFAKNISKLKINDELSDYAWFSKKDLENPIVPPDVKFQALRAFEIFEKLKK